jgi:hypothetical protein
MKNEIIPYAGWHRNMGLSNDHIELVVTLDVGPRIISLKNPGGENVFKNYPKQLGGTDENEWMIRGGHRFWIAPEDSVRTYHLDNIPVDQSENPVTGEMLFVSKQEVGGRILKTLGVSLAADAPRATIRHTAKNLDSVPLEFAIWGLSVMDAGGVEVIPHPPLGEHPRDLLPNRAMILWPYTDMSDPRWHFGRDFLSLRQSEGFPPSKLGLVHREKWIAYIVGDSVFLKTFDYIDGATYPDWGCNFETFTNGEMLEIESLGPLKTLAPGEEITHIEEWCLLPVDAEAVIESEEALVDWLAPYLIRSGLLGSC